MIILEPQAKPVPTSPSGTPQLVNSILSGLVIGLILRRDTYVAAPAVTTTSSSTDNSTQTNNIVVNVPEGDLP